MSRPAAVTLVCTAAFVATVYAANWALTRWGVVPVGFGLHAPAGVYFAGLGFLLRDVLHELGGRAWVLAAILAGAALSYLLGASVTIPGGLVTIAVASGAAFMVSELCDLAVYTPLRVRHRPVAVGLSQLAGALVDSLLFLWLAFGTVDGQLLAGQVVGKLLLVIPVVALLALRRRRRLVAA